jgi:hypothetical protein
MPKISAPPVTYQVTVSSKSLKIVEIWPSKYAAKQAVMRLRSLYPKASIKKEEISN